MTNEELIARQAKRIAELEDARKRLAVAIENAIGNFVRVGGPLNGNSLKYGPAQRKELRAICAALAEALE